MNLYKGTKVSLLVIATIASALTSGNAQSLTAPTALTAAVQTVNSVSTVKLAWNGVTGASFYWINRNGKAYTTANTPVYTDLRVTPGVTYTYTISATNKTGTGPESNSATAAAPIIPPAPPVDGAGSSEWETSCTICGHGAMAHNSVTWAASSGATSYNLYKDGVLYKAGLAMPAYTDMTRASGSTICYSVCAVNGGGMSARSGVVPVVVASPPPPVSTTIPVPTNLVIQGTWLDAATDMLAWSPIPGAASYNVYQYDRPIARGITSCAYTVPTDKYQYGLSYAVTAVDAFGFETIPSNIVTAQGAQNPTKAPIWLPPAPVAPVGVTATPEWNMGAPRIRLTWRGSSADFTYSVYRDGVAVAAGLWGLNYIDNNVTPGETHTYTVTGSNVPVLTPVESAVSAAVTAQAPLGAPSSSTSTVQITSINPNDDSVFVTFAAVPGAVDYRIMNTAKPGTYKYTGGALYVELNGLDPVNGADLVVQAVDKLGPFQKMDGSMTGPGATFADGSLNSAINGMGDPSNVPNVLAASSVFHVTMSPRGLTGSQVFFDNFRDETDLVQMPSVDQAIVDNNGGDPNDANNRYVREYQNSKWMIRDYWGDMANTSLFFMDNHFMDTLYDGGTPRSNVPIHNNNASLVFSPKAVADISGDKVLHVTFEVDAHFNGRRWCDVFVAAAGDPLIRPGKFAEAGDNPTVSGNLFRWEIKGNTHLAQLFSTGSNIDLLQPASWNDQQTYTRTSWDKKTRLANGDVTNLDKRHKFDLYLSRTHVKIVETTPDGVGNVVREKEFPAGAALPFTQCQVYFVHQVYHTANDRPENIDYNQADTYWINHRPWADERHWDNIGFEVLDGFPR